MYTIIIFYILILKFLICVCVINVFKFKRFVNKTKQKMAHKWAQINLLFKQHDAVCENENTCVAPGATLCRVYDRAL